MPISMQTRLSLPKLPQRDKGSVPRSQTERLWLVGGGLVAFVMVLIGYFFFISPQRSNTSDVKAQVASTEQQNAVLQARIDQLRAQNKDLAKYEAGLAEARRALPTTSGMSDFLRTLQTIGNETQSDLTALTVGQPVNLSLAAMVQSSAAAPAATASTPATGTVPGAVPGAVATGPSIVALPVTATVAGTPAALAKFLDQLQAVQPRAVLITQLTQVAPSQGGKTSETTLNLTMRVFVSATPTPVSAAPSPTASH